MKSAIQITDMKGFAEQPGKLVWKTVSPCETARGFEEAFALATEAGDEFLAVDTAHMAAIAAPGRDDMLAWHVLREDLQVLGVGWCTAASSAGAPLTGGGFLRAGRQCGQHHGRERGD